MRLLAELVTGQCKSSQLSGTSSVAQCSDITDIRCLNEFLKKYILIDKKVNYNCMIKISITILPFISLHLCLVMGVWSTDYNYLNPFMESFLSR